MAIEVHPATEFDDVAAVIGPKSPTANVCWCLSYRRLTVANNDLRGSARGAYVQELCQQRPGPGVLAYDGDTPVGWAAIAPRSHTTFARSRQIPHVDDVPAWSLWCIRVRPGHRKAGISHHLIAGAVEFARANGAPVVEAYPLDNQGAKVDQTTAYSGLRRNFERAGFVYVTDTASRPAGFQRVLMRFDLRAASGG